MRVIEPRDTSLQSTNVAANTEPEWSAGATYGLDDTVKVTTSTPHTVYKSLRGNNTNRPPVDSLEPVQETGTSTTSVAVGTGIKTFTTQSGLSFSAGMVVKVTKTTTPKSVNMTAEVTSYNSSTGALSVTVYAKTGEGTHTNWTVTSEDEIGFWEEVGSTNQYAMFDEYVNTQTENLNEISVKLNIEKADYIALWGLSGVRVELELWDKTETTQLWGEEIDLIYGALGITGITDWYEYFFGESTAKVDGAAQLGVTIYEGILSVKIVANQGQGAKCGNILVGRDFDLGVTRYNASAGLMDFSDISTDEKTGKTKVVQGTWAKRNSIKMRIPNYRLDAIYKLLERLRGVPTAWIANNEGIEFETFIVFGIFRDFNLTYSYANYSWLELEIKGVV